MESFLTIQFCLELFCYTPFFCHSYNLLRFWFLFMFNSIFCAYFYCHDFLFIAQQVFRRRVGELENLTGEQIEKSRKELADLERKFLERVAQTNRSKTTGGGVVKCTSDKNYLFLPHFHFVNLHHLWSINFLFLICIVFIFMNHNCFLMYLLYLSS